MVSLWNMDSTIIQAYNISKIVLLRPMKNEIMLWMLIFYCMVSSTRCGKHFYNLECIRSSQPILRLHKPAMRHINGNFVGFQNMCDFKMSDP